MNSSKIESRLALRARGKAPSPIREIFPLMSIPGMISFGGGYPNPDTFPFTRMKLCLRDGTELETDTPHLKKALQYGPSDSFLHAREQITRWHEHKDGVMPAEGSLVVLNGAQEGLFIAAYLFLEESDSVVVSEPTYPGALSAFGSFCRNFVAIPLDEYGMDTDALESVLENTKRDRKRLPKLIYTIPNGHNPGGVALSEERKEHLIRIAEEFDILIVEDDPYQLVRLDDSSPGRTLQAMDHEGRVIRLDSFSKVLSPGLRLGYASGDPVIMRHFLLFKQSANLHTSSLTQQMLAAHIEASEPEGFMSQIRESCRLYRSNRNSMVHAANELLPGSVEFDIPSEGLFIWFRLPSFCNAANMIKRYSRDLKVILVPGPAFSSTGGCTSCMRASYSMVRDDEIREGINRFAEMIRREERV